MTDMPDATTLSSALEAELRALAAQAPRELRLRLLVAAHAAGLIMRDLASIESNETCADPDVVAALRGGAYDQDLPALAVRLRAEVAARLAVAAPGYAATSGADTRSS